MAGGPGAEQVATHPLRGPLFENAAVCEAFKYSHNYGRYAEPSFFRTADGLECDLLYPTPAGLAAVEIKSGTTFTGAWFAGLRRIESTVPAVRSAAIVYGGDQPQARSDATAMPLAAFSDYLHSLHHPQNPPPTRTARKAAADRRGAPRGPHSRSSGSFNKSAI